MKNRQIFTAFAVLAAALIFPLQTNAQRPGKRTANPQRTTQRTTNPPRTSQSKTDAQQRSAERSGPKTNLRASNSTAQIHRVQMRLEGSGTVLPAKDSTLKMRLDASFQYDERVIARTRMLKSIRDYERAEARINLGEGTTTNRLSPESSIIIAQANQLTEPVKLAAIGEPISQTEFELLNTPLNTLVLSQLFARDNVGIGETWKPDSVILARVLNLDSVEENEVEIKLEKVESGIATIFTGGDVTGTIDGTGTEFSISGTSQFDIRRGEVTTSQFTLSQQRDIGTVTPGLDAVFKIAARITPVTTSEYLTDQGLAELRKDAGRITDQFILETEKENWSLMHPREWRVISQQPTMTTLRYMTAGQLLGQCDIIPLPDRMSSQEQTLEQFQRVVETRLADNSATITGANEITTESGLEIMRVDATGQSDDVQLKWTWYTISHEDGRRVQLRFTTEPKTARDFAGRDQVLLKQIRFIEPAEDEESAVPAQNAAHSR